MQIAPLGQNVATLGPNRLIVGHNFYDRTGNFVRTIEPSTIGLSALDALNRDLILQLLADLQAVRSLAYLYVSHDLRLVSQFADEVVVMYQGHIVEQKKTRELFARPAHFHTRELLAAVHSVESILLERSA